MQVMNEHPLWRFEKRLVRLWGGRITQAQVVGAVLQAFEDAIAADSQHEIPSHLTLHLHPQDHAALLADHPYLQPQLAASIADHARKLGVPLATDPLVECLPEPRQARGRLRVFATVRDITDNLEQVDLSPENALLKAALWRDGRVVLSIQRAVINIGRQRDNHLVLDDARVSRQHCQLRFRHGQYRIYDLESTHGVYLNGMRITEQVLTHGDVISLGGVELIYVIENDTNDLAAQTNPHPPSA